MDADLLVHDYLGRVDAAAASLPAQRRVELVAEVREHIDVALAEAGSRGEVSVRNVLERLGAPEEIVAGEAVAASSPGDVVSAVAGAPMAGTGAPMAGAGTPAQWGRVELAAALLLPLAWVALLLPHGLFPYGLFVWLLFGVVVLMLVWFSRVWSQRRKVVVTVVVVAQYVMAILITLPVSKTCTFGGDPTPQPCPIGGASPGVTGE